MTEEQAGKVLATAKGTGNACVKVIRGRGARSHSVSHLSARQEFEKSCGAKGIRTPDLLHAI
jgi:hypothetical protein